MQKDLTAELKQAAAIIKSGGVVAFPTDTVYGLGALADNPEAVRRVFEIKGRPLSQALPLLVINITQAMDTASRVSETAKILMARFWPGALTLVFPRATWVSDMVTAGGSTVAVRVPNHPLTIELIKAAGGPLVGTSANLHGYLSPVTAEEVREQLGNSVDLIIDGGRAPGGVESTIVDVSIHPPRILRQGMIKREDIEVLW